MVDLQSALETSSKELEIARLKIDKRDKMLKEKEELIEQLQKKLDEQTSEYSLGVGGNLIDNIHDLCILIYKNKINIHTFCRYYSIPVLYDYIFAFGKGENSCKKKIDFLSEYRRRYVRNEFQCDFYSPKKLCECKVLVPQKACLAGSNGVFCTSQDCVTSDMTIHCGHAMQGEKWLMYLAEGQKNLN